MNTPLPTAQMYRAVTAHWLAAADRGDAPSW